LSLSTLKLSCVIRPRVPRPPNMSEQAPPSAEIVTLTRCERTGEMRVTPLTTSLSHTLNSQAKLGASASGDLTILLTAIQTTCKFISTNVRRARLLNL
jgi:fructose-1,6-bisphosphatase I